MTNQPHLECFIQTKFQLGDCRILIEKLASKIKKKGNEELDTIYRSLAYLMGLILNKRDASWKRKITAKRLMKKFGIYDDNHMINEEFPREILDHVYAYKIFYNKGTVDEEVIEILYSEPYNFGQQEAEQLSIFCNKHNLNWWIGRSAEHFPNETIKICITIKIAGEKQNE